MKGRVEDADWKGRYDPSGAPAFREALKDPANPIRRVLDILLESAKEMVRDGRMKIVDGVPVFRDDVQQMLAEREARAHPHAHCAKSDPCGGVFNPRLKVSLPASENTHPGRGTKFVSRSLRARAVVQYKSRRKGRAK